MQKAQMLDQTVQQMTAIKQQIEMLTNQVGVLQGQVNSGEAILTALTDAYTDCMTGTPV
jgi:prefoldin subunit 5